VNPVSEIQNLPKELLRELPFHKRGESSYSSRDLVLTYLANADHACTSSELMVYVYAVNKVVMKRSYLYQLLYRLRKAGHVLSENGPGSTKVFRVTSEGLAAARPYLQGTGLSSNGTG